MPKIRSRTGRNVARLALAGVVVGAPLALAVPAEAAPNWDALAQCESGGRWNINTGNGYAGGLQFTPSTWAAYGGTQYSSSAAGASREQQIAVAERVLAGQGSGAWPACSAKTGWHNGAGAATAKAAAKASAKASAKSAAKAPAKSTAKSTAKAPAKATTPQKVTTKAAAPAASTAPQNGADYTVKAGDTLSGIAAAHGVNGGWTVLFDRNRNLISDPDLIYPGQQLDIS
jgi:resuscitation-promoting factor RpfA